MPNPLASTKQDNWGELGPAMRALSERHRIFVTYYLHETFTNHRKNNYGAGASAARKAGFAGTQPRTLARTAFRLLRDDGIVAAIAQESRKLLRAGAPEAVKAVLNGVRDPESKNHGKFVQILMDRSDPIESRSFVEVTHKHVDRDAEDLEELRALRQLGTSREKLFELFGQNGLDRLERLERLDTLRRSNEAKVIDNVAPEVVKKSKPKKPDPKPPEVVLEAPDEMTIEIETAENPEDDF